ncbi:hypothetical protein GCM10011515_11840 [Tsuneonella deserti]|uniref:Lipoprotein n=1 Tax=Tsuneonella deserti TaxID=2035528 RepID=A0ABQ1S577_9SPHN|nr:hypothetical protein [Tsuneonella deserti]GGD93686.1 hypothetical protein GCM10011515_11840 [Tsuneonella deserti]
MNRAAPLILLCMLAACETTNSSDWSGGPGTPFKQAERSCQDLLGSVSKEEDRRDFFVGCMRALGWTPKPGASIDL